MEILLIREFYLTQCLIARLTLDHRASENDRCRLYCSAIIRIPDELNTRNDFENGSARVLRRMSEETEGNLWSQFLEIANEDYRLTENANTAA